MHNRKLTVEHLGRGKSREMFIHLQNTAGLQEHGKARVDDAMKAAIAHVQKKHGLRLGMTDKHIDMALGYLKNHYEGRKLLKTKEKEVIKHSLDMFFNRKPEEAEVEKEEKIGKGKEIPSPARIIRAPTSTEPKLSEVSPQAQVPVANDNQSQLAA